MNLMFDREIQRVRNNKDNLRSFLMDQQQWLSNMKSDINAYKTMGSTALSYAGPGLSASAFYPKVSMV